MTVGDTSKILMNWWTVMETGLGAVSRVQEFIAELPEEEPRSPPPEGWPSNGSIEVEELSVSHGSVLP
jgi:ABC-type multidrug transport system fused ATPase/permease subunit